ncbi:MAG TPA: addiction module protein [Bacteroidia bacterium]|nr:addiction module protein [Bacteroidia bacterium]
MTATVERLVQEALLLPSESRTELVEAILEGTLPSPEWIEPQMAVVLERIENVREGRSALIPEEEAHRRVRESLRETR